MLTNIWSQVLCLNIEVITPSGSIVAMAGIARQKKIKNGYTRFQGHTAAAMGSSSRMRNAAKTSLGSTGLFLRYKKRST